MKQFENKMQKDIDIAIADTELPKPADIKEENKKTTRTVANSATKPAKEGSTLHRDLKEHRAVMKGNKRFMMPFQPKPILKTCRLNVGVLLIRGAPLGHFDISLP